MNTKAPQSITEIVATVRENLVSGTAAIGPTHYDKNGQPIDLRGRAAIEADSLTAMHNLPEPYGSAYRELIPRGSPAAQPSGVVPLDPVDRAHVVMLAERFEEQLTALQMLLRSGYHPDSAKPLRDRMNMLGEYQPAQVYGRPDTELPAILRDLDARYRAQIATDDAERDPVFDVCDDPYSVSTLADNDDASEYEAGFGDE